jgi:hypothetical protein
MPPWTDAQWQDEQKRIIAMIERQELDEESVFPATGHEPGHVKAALILVWAYQALSLQSFAERSLVPFPASKDEIKGAILTLARYYRLAGASGQKKVNWLEGTYGYLANVPYFTSPEFEKRLNESIIRDGRASPLLEEFGRSALMERIRLRQEFRVAMGYTEGKQGPHAGDGPAGKTGCGGMLALSAITVFVMWGIRNLALW